MAESDKQYKLVFSCHHFPENTITTLDHDLSTGSSFIVIMVHLFRLCKCGVMNLISVIILSFPFLCSGLRFMYRVKVGESLFAEASAPNKKAARQLAAEEAVKELMADGKLQLNKVFNE